MSLAPKLKKRTVSSDVLLLDPNNPRLFSKTTERVPSRNIPDPGVQEATRLRLRERGDRFRISELCESIRRNGYVPEAGGYIFVRALSNTNYFLVLEGNRRVVALRELLGGKKDLQESVRHSIEAFDVQEIVDDIPEDKLQEKISYLLGTCHHGSHKDWSPFARARGIYERYLNQSHQTNENFKYERYYGGQVAALLSIREQEVKERIMVYRAMQQLAEDERISVKPQGGIIGSYYSVVEEAVPKARKGIKKYIAKDPNTFRLEEEAVDRLINLCNFDGTPKRHRVDDDGIKLKDENDKPVPPPIKNPSQWRHLNSILEDLDKDKRNSMLMQVEEEYQFPEDVYARRRAEITQMTWKRWLQQVKGILSDVRMEDDFDSVEAKEVIQELEVVVRRLNQDSVGNKNA